MKRQGKGSFVVVGEVMKAICQGLLELFVKYGVLYF